MLDANHAPTPQRMFYTNTGRTSRRDIDGCRVLFEELSVCVHSPDANRKGKTVTYIQTLFWGCAARNDQAEAVRYVQTLSNGCVRFVFTFLFYTIPPFLLGSIQRKISSVEEVGKFFTGLPLG